MIGSPTVGLQPGSLAPELAVDLGGGSTSCSIPRRQPDWLADLRGKGVWINFFASWCPPCQSETPVLREVHKAYRDRGLELVAVEVQETVDQGRRDAETYGLEYTIGADISGHVFHQYLVYALPTQIFIDPQGIIRGVVGAPLDDATARQWVELILPVDLGTTRTELRRPR